MGISRKVPVRALLLSLVNNWRKIRDQNKLYHDHMKRDLQAALRSIPEDYNVDAFVSAVLDVLSHRCSDLRGLSESILIVGPYRIGKSTVSGMVAGKGRHVHVPVDVLSIACREWPEPAQRDALLSVIVSAILMQMPKGVILEGGVHMDLMRVLAKHVHIVILGDVSDAQDRAEGIIEYRASNWCWTAASMSNEEHIRKMAESIIERSRKLEKLSDELGVPFIPLRGSHAEADIQRAVDLIWDQINSA